jgi:hypothetical protein
MTSIADILAAANQPTIEELLVVANAKPVPTPDSVMVRRVKTELETLASQYGGRFVLLDPGRGRAIFATVINAANFEASAIRHFTNRNLPFTPSRVGGEVRITWAT